MRGRGRNEGERDREGGIVKGEEEGGMREADKTVHTVLSVI